MIKNCNSLTFTTFNKKKKFVSGSRVENSRVHAFSSSFYKRVGVLCTNHAAIEWVLKVKPN